MEKITKPKVSLLASGTELIAKQMQAAAGDLMPKHLANVESILFVHEGKCTLTMNEKENQLKQGDAFIVPADTKHQIRAEADFKGIHLMPKGIKFQFFD